jgi:predicted kinase
MALALFVLGHAGSGKTRLAKRWIKSRLKKGEPWALLDKDVCGEALANALLCALGLDPNDRDSPAYKKTVRDLEYQACLDVARAQLKLGINVALPGPWTRELESGKAFDAEALGFPSATRLAHVYLDASVERMRQRVFARDNPRDLWKREHWDQFAQGLAKPQAVARRSVACVGLVEDEDENFASFAKALKGQA